jgi:hypothetical protein
MINFEDTKRGETQKSIIELQQSIESVIEEAVSACADLADKIGKDFVCEALNAPNEKSKDTHLGWANGAFRVRDVIRSRKQKWVKSRSKETKNS